MSAATPDLFDQPVARRSDPPTSHAAAADAARHASRTRALALATLQQHPAGLTDFELADLTNVQQTSIGVRRGDLVRARPPLVEAARDENGAILKRPSPTGSAATVWRVIP